ncbi:glutamate carboxypeptidase 2-like [Ornithodoros turicata]|uniref:glutamate carboxypeptidase 2-like n=1 Tax=Ornithodoros turicata TaxID=34597 RepID=UPI003138F8A2
MTAKKVLLTLFVLAIGVGAGVLIGHYVIPKALSRLHIPEVLKHVPGGAKGNVSTKTEDAAFKAGALEDVQFDPAKSNVLKRIIRMVDGAKIKEHVSFLASEPHMAGTNREEVVLANYVKDKFTEYGLDEVKVVSYDVLLSYPNASDPNTVSVVNASNGNLLWTAATQEEAIPNIPTNIGPAFLAYSPPGDVVGSVVYVNHGTNEDFDDIEALNSSVAGAICLMRYGQGFRGQKVRNCAARGGVAALLFLDPGNVSPNPGAPPYPNSTFVSGSAMQRGSLIVVGDPLTPGYPATETATRINPSFAPLPTIPSHVIGYDDAKNLLEMLGGPEAPANFHGGLNVTYRIGPFSEENEEKVVQLRVNNFFTIGAVKNVIGVLKGSVEPDRYVLTGNHRDALGYGAVSPSSGTGALLELARVLGTLKGKGIRPRRTVLFCNWGASEYGHIGSTEWVEEHLLELQDRAVAYIDMAHCASGPVFVSSASPALAGIVGKAARLVPDSDSPKESLFNTWKRSSNAATKTDVDPQPGDTGGASDNSAFNFFAGIPSVGFAFLPNEETGFKRFPAYHTAYDTLHMYQTYVDPVGNFGKTCARLNGALVHLLSEAVILPMDMERFVGKLQEYLDDLDAVGVSAQLEANGVFLADLRFEIENLRNVSKTWSTYVKSLKNVKSATIRRLNDQMMRAEKEFLKSSGLPGRPLVRHLAFAPPEVDQDRGVGFPVFTDLLYYINKLPPEAQGDGWRNLRFYVSDLIRAVQGAAKTLEVL